MTSKKLDFCEKLLLQPIRDHLVTCAKLIKTETHQTKLHQAQAHIVQILLNHAIAKRSLKPPSLKVRSLTLGALQEVPCGGFF